MLQGVLFLIFFSFFIQPVNHHTPLFLSNPKIQTKITILTFTTSHLCEENPSLSSTLEPLYCSSLATALGGIQDINFVDFRTPIVARITCSILSPLEDFSCRPMPAPICRDASSTLRVHQFKLSKHVSSWGIYARKSARTCPFLANLGLYWIPYSLSSTAQRAILPNKSDL